MALNFYVQFSSKLCGRFKAARTSFLLFCQKAEPVPVDLLHVLAQVRRFSCHQERHVTVNLPAPCPPRNGHAASEAGLRCEDGPRAWLLWNAKHQRNLATFSPPLCSLFQAARAAIAERREARIAALRQGSGDLQSPAVAARAEMEPERVEKPAEPGPRPAAAPAAAPSAAAAQP